MASFRREDLFGEPENDVMIAKSSQSRAVGEGKQAVGRLQYRGYRSRKDTEVLIRKALGDAGRPLKFAEVAQAVDRSASPFLRGILIGMAERGEIIETADLAPNERLPRFWYALR